MSPPPTLAGAHCGAHPAVAAVEICSRCGTFLCGECVEYFQDTTPCCAACLPSVKLAGASSWRARVCGPASLVGLGLLASGFLVAGRGGLGLWLLGLPFTFLGVLAAVVELWRIRTGESGPRNKPFAWLGFATGAVALVGYGSLFAAFLYFTWRLGTQG